MGQEVNVDAEALKKALANQQLLKKYKKNEQTSQRKAVVDYKASEDQVKRLNVKTSSSTSKLEPMLSINKQEESK